MTRKELKIISEVISQLVIESLVPIIKKLIKEETNKLLVEQSRPIKRQKIKEDYADNTDFKTTINEILESTRPKMSLPSTGNNLLDNILKETPTEEELIAKAQTPFVNKQTSKINNIVPIEEIYLNDIKGITPDIAEHIDYSSFLKQMDSMRGSINNSPLYTSGISNTKALYIKDKASIIEEQRVGKPKVEKTIPMR